MSHKVKRLIALGIAFRAGCTACILHQPNLAVEAGASKAEVLEAVEVAVAISGSRSIVIFFVIDLLHYLQDHQKHRTEHIQRRVLEQPEVDAIGRPNHAGDGQYQ